MKEHSAQWAKGAFFICEKCGRRDDADPDLKGFAEDTKKEFKSELKNMGHGKEARVMVSGCLGLCPPERQAAAWFPVSGAVEILEFKKSDKKEIFDWLLKKLK